MPMSPRAFEARERAQFAAAKFRWLREVATDGELGHLAVRVALLLSDNVSLSTGIAWRSQEMLGEWCGGATDRSVRRAISELIERGHLEVHRTGARMVNRYGLLLEGEPVTGQWCPLTDVDDRTPVSAQDDDDRTFGEGDRTPVSSMTGHPCPPTSFLSLSKLNSFPDDAGERARGDGSRSPALRRELMFKPGDRISHQRHGEGLVTEVEIDDRYPNSPYLTADFDDGSQRVLATVVRRVAPRKLTA
jgi:hypothetical protein